MKPFEEVIGQAVRVEHIESNDKIYVVFEITNPKYKEQIKREWTADIEFELIGKELIKKEEK
jgi:hypothetical protein